MRIRLGPVPARPEPTVGGDHICLVLPALDEAGRIGEVIRRLPPVVGGLPTRCLVVDDGSTDATAAEARAAGAQVLAMGRRQGLGAAIRAGLRTSVERGAAIVAFCDADGEYAPEELPRLAEPILRGRADYVVGSRFSGVIESMRPHRRLGNVVLTAALRMIARTPISDGQSGYRALSRRAAAEATIVHDYNYAQVLTLDLLAKGFVYGEVPITYRFGRSGRSFIRLPTYLRHVVPGVARQLSASVGQSSTT